MIFFSLIQIKFRNEINHVIIMINMIDMIDIMKNIDIQGMINIDQMI